MWCMWFTPDKMSIQVRGWLSAEAPGTGVCGDPGESVAVLAACPSKTIYVITYTYTDYWEGNAKRYSYTMTTLTMQAVGIRGYSLSRTWLTR